MAKKMNSHQAKVAARIKADKAARKKADKKAKEN